MKYLSVCLIFICVGLMSCNKTNRIPESQFVGVWELHGRSAFEGIRVKVAEEKSGLTGRLQTLNDHKYVQMFADTGDVWISGIERSSNFLFKLSEKKLANPLFTMYDLSGTQQFDAQFIGKDTLGLAEPGMDPLKSKIRYVRIR